MGSSLRTKRGKQHQEYYLHNYTLYKYSGFGLIDNQKGLLLYHYATKYYFLKLDKTKC
jgi:hypothetical protein